MDKLFPVNQHPIERTARTLLGIVLIALAVSGNTVWGYIGVVPLLTGLVGTCPVYTLFGITTCPLKAPQKTM